MSHRPPSRSKGTAAPVLARVTRLAVPSDRLDELVKLGRRHVAPRVQRHEGHLGGLVLVDRARGELLSIGFWADAASLDASSPDLAAAWGVGMALDAPPRLIAQEVLEVAFELPGSGRRDPAAR